MENNQNQKEYEEWKQKKISHLEEFQEEIKENGSGEETEEPRKSLGAEIWDYVKLIIVVVMAVVLLQNFIVINARIPSESMQETIMVGDQIFGNRLAYKFGDPARYDIVIFHYPDNPDQLFIKRVIGLPGETVHIRQDGVYINDDDTPLSQDFCPETPDYLGADEMQRLMDSLSADSLKQIDLPEGTQIRSTCPDGTVTTITYDENGTVTELSYEVPQDSYFMMGDNRNNSHDSRYWTSKSVEREQIVGKAFLRYWPLTAIKLLNTGSAEYYQPDTTVTGANVSTPDDAAAAEAAAETTRETDQQSQVTGEAEEEAVMQEAS